MSKKSNLKILQGAVARIMKAIENDDGQNPLFSDTLAFYQQKWLEDFYTETTKSPKPGRKTIAKPGSPDKKDTPMRQN